MAQVPIPLMGDNITDLKRQIWELIRPLYEDNVAGLTIGDVFENQGDVLTLRLSASSGLQKTSGALEVAANPTGGLQITSTGIAAKLKTGGGITSDSFGLSLSGLTYGFGTIACPAGTNPVADSINQTLTLLAGTGISITGSAGTDSVTIASTGGGLTSLTASPPLYASAGANPNITTNVDSHQNYFVGGGGTSWSGGSGYNVGIAFQSLYSLQTGTNNFGLGYASLYSLLDGAGNLAIGGGGVQYGNQHGYYNVALGYTSMNAMGASAGCNIGIGAYTLTNVGGNYNLAIGCAAGYPNVDGSYNTFLCTYPDAGSANVHGSGNVFIGYSAGYNEAGSNKLYIANSNTATPLIYGEFDTVRVGIGIVATAKLHLPASDGGASNAPLKFTAGTLLGTPEVGAMEFVDDGTNGHLYITRHIAGILTRSLII